MVNTEFIGAGKYSKVYKLDEIYAIKILTNKRAYLKEARAALKLRGCLYIIHLYCAYVQNKNGHLIYELMDSNLYEWIPPDFTQLLLMANSIIQGLNFMQSKGYAHRDIKPGNILLKQKTGAPPVFKIGDLGFACNPAKTRGCGFAGTLLYMAPEYAHFSKKTDQNIRIHSLDFLVRADIYSLGVTLKELLYRMFENRCFETSEKQQILHYTKNINIPFQFQNNLKTYEIIDLINGMIRHQPQYRLDHFTIINNINKII